MDDIDSVTVCEAVAANEALSPVIDNEPVDERERTSDTLSVPERLVEFVLVADA